MEAFPSARTNQTSIPQARPNLERRETDKPQRDGASRGDRTNVGPVERLASTMLGGLLVVRAVRRPSPSAAALVVGAGALLQRGLTGHCYVYEAIGRNTLSRSNSERSGGSRQTQRSLTIEKPVHELYDAWSDPELLNAIMGDFAEVRAGSEGRLHWRAQLPGGRTFDWTTIRTEDQPDARIGDPSRMRRSNTRAGSHSRRRPRTGARS